MMTFIGQKPREAIRELARSEIRLRTKPKRRSRANNTRSQKRNFTIGSGEERTELETEEDQEKDIMSTRVYELTPIIGKYAVQHHQIVKQSENINIPVGTFYIWVGILSVPILIIGYIVIVLIWTKWKHRRRTRVRFKNEVVTREYRRRYS